MNAVLDGFEQKAFIIPKLDKVKISELNSFFKSKVTPENGIYGVTEKIRDDGVLVQTTKTESGTTLRNYIVDGVKRISRERIDEGVIKTTQYDDNGSAYFTKVDTTSKNTILRSDAYLSPNTTIVKNNFLAITDGQGRPILNRITDLQVKEPNAPRENFNNIIKTDYRANDQRGHIIADKFFAPSSAENVVPQLDSVNMSKFKTVENKIIDLKSQGKKVDYEVKTNYADSTNRPSSFEIKIKVDNEYVSMEDLGLDKDLSKIYNEETPSRLTKFKLSAGETIQTLKPSLNAGKEMGVKSAEITCVVSTVINVSKIFNNEISIKEAVTNVASDSLKSGALGFGLGFTTDLVSRELLSSSSEVLKKLGGSSLPAMIISCGVVSVNDIKNFKNGNIDIKEFLYNIGENATGVVGGFLGASMGGIAGGMVGSAVATKAYEKSVDFVKDHVDDVSDLAVDIKNATVEKVSDVKDIVIDKAIDVKNFTVDKAKDVADIADNVKDAAVEKLGDVKDFVADKASGTIDMANYAKNAAVDKISDVKSGAVKTFSSAKGKIVGFVKK